jgi:hypothetical protein
MTATTRLRARIPSSLRFPLPLLVRESKYWFQEIRERSRVVSIMHSSWRSRARGHGCACCNRVNSSIPPRLRNPMDVRRLLRFAYLAPDIVQEIVEGRQPRTLTVKRLLQGIPLDWSDQRAGFGVR